MYLIVNMGQVGPQGLGALLGGSLLAAAGFGMVMLARSQRGHPNWSGLDLFRTVAGGIAFSVAGLVIVVHAAVTTSWYWVVGYAFVVVVLGVISRRVVPDLRKTARVRSERVAQLTADLRQGTAAAAGDLSRHFQLPAPPNAPTPPTALSRTADPQSVNEGWFATLQRVRRTPIAAPDVETRAMLEAIDSVRERYAGRTFAPESALPATKEELLRAVRAQRAEIRPTSNADREMRGIILELECFIPDELAARAESIEHPSAQDMGPGFSEHMMAGVGYYTGVLDSIARMQADTAVLLHQDVRGYTAEGVVNFLHKHPVTIGGGKKWLEKLDDDQAEMTFVATGALASGIPLLLAFIAWTQKLFGIQTWELAMIIPVWVIGVSFGEVGVWIHRSLRSRSGSARRVADGVSLAAVLAFPSLLIVGFHLVMLRLGLVP